MYTMPSWLETLPLVRRYIGRQPHNSHVYTYAQGMLWTFTDCHIPAAGRRGAFLHPQNTSRCHPAG